MGGFVCLLMIAPSADIDARVRVALALAATKPAVPYPAAYRRAVAEGRVLVVWVNCSDRAAEAATPEMVHVRVGRFPGVTSSCVVIGITSNGELRRVADLKPAAATPARLRLFARPPPAPPARDCGH